MRPNDALANLRPRLSRNGRARETIRGWQLWIPAGVAGQYRLAQLDDYAGRLRSAYPWRPPLTLSLRARVSASGLPGTWGFGLWNDPYGFSCGPGDTLLRLPALPHAAWFFSASPRSYLSLRDDGVANGFYAQVLQSPGLDRRLLETALALPFAPRRARRTLSRIIREDAATVGSDPTEWHQYEIQWQQQATGFTVDGRVLMESGLSPKPPLTLVIWIDNQFAAFDPSGRLVWGTENSPNEAWLELEELSCRPAHGAG